MNATYNQSPRSDLKTTESTLKSKTLEEECQRETIKLKALIQLLQYKGQQQRSQLQHATRAPMSHRTFNSKLCFN